MRRLGSVGIIGYMNRWTDINVYVYDDLVCKKCVVRKTAPLTLTHICLHEDSLSLPLSSFPDTQNTHHEPIGHRRGGKVRLEPFQIDLGMDGQVAW